MKILSFFLFVTCIFFTTQLYAQKAHLELINTQNGKTKTIKVNKRVHVETVDGEDYQGKLTIKDANGIYIDDDYLLFKNIETIQRDQLFEKITGIFLLTVSGLSLLIAPIVAIVGGQSAIALGVSGVTLAGGLYSLILQPKHKTKTWTYKNVIE